MGLSARELRVPVEGARFLRAWLCRGAGDRLVVLGHGIGLSASAALWHAKFLHDAGYSVCLFDHRNHGASSRDRGWTRLADRFTSDIVAVVDALRDEEGYRDARVAVYGFSFSTFASVYSLTRPGFSVDAVICDSGPSLDIPPLFDNLLATGALPVPRFLGEGRPRAALARWIGSLGTAMLGASWPPTDGRLDRVPLLFLAGARDAVVPASAVSAFAARYPHAVVEVLPGAGHLDGLRADGTRYSAVVLDFLDRALGPSTRPVPRPRSAGDRTSQQRRRETR